MSTTARETPFVNDPATAADERQKYTLTERSQTANEKKFVSSLRPRVNGSRIFFCFVYVSRLRPRANGSRLRKK